MTDPKSCAACGFVWLGRVITFRTFRSKEFNDECCLLPRHCTGKNSLLWVLQARLEAEAAAAEASAAAEAEVLQEGSSGTGHDLDLTICRHLQLARLSLEINN